MELRVIRNNVRFKLKGKAYFYERNAVPDAGNGIFLLTLSFVNFPPLILENPVK